MVSFEIFVKAIPPSLSELKVLPSFCFPIKIPDDRSVTNIYIFSIFRYETIETNALASLTHVIFAIGGVNCDLDFSSQTHSIFSTIRHNE